VTSSSPLVGLTTETALPETEVVLPHIPLEARPWFVRGWRVRVGYETCRLRGGALSVFSGLQVAFEISSVTGRGVMARKLS
jgi:hypothetical protein